jgi:2-polyprenyl-6-methoxyphenol hydroxylase-like FAD-dependent oxidoreductase
MAKIGNHAVVLGASMAGLLAARALADFFETVTIVERDTQPTRFGQRRTT